MIEYDLIAVIPARFGSSRVDRNVLQEIMPIFPLDIIEF